MAPEDVAMGEGEVGRNRGREKERFQFERRG